MTRSAAAIVLAGGSGSRMGAGENKAYLPLAGRRLISWSLRAMADVAGIGVLVLVARPEDHDQACDALRRDTPDLDVEVVAGGATRQASELSALRHLAERIDAGELDTVLIHDGARPLVSPELVANVLAATRTHGGAVPGLAAADLVAIDAGNGALLGPRLTGVVRVQTPQGFRARPLLDAYEAAARDGFDGTDTASCLERYTELPVRCIEGDPRNFKITYPRDLAVAERLLARATTTDSG